jgi:homospermidine synthase
MLSRFHSLVTPRAKMKLTKVFSQNTILRRLLHSVEYKNLAKQTPFKDTSHRKYVFIGVGSIAKPSLHYLDQFVDVDYKNVYLVDQYDMREKKSLKKVFDRGAHFIQQKLGDNDWEPLFRKLDLKPYDVVVDLTTDTNGLMIVEILRKMSVIYMNTAIEINWHNVGSSLYDNSLQIRHDKLKEIIADIKDPHNATHMYEFGMNPGIISHFVFQGLLDVAGHVLKHHKDEKLAEYVANKQYNLIAKHLNLQTIHCSELDTQIARNLRDDGTFINTWSVYGLLEEGLEPAQAGWGSHEKTIPADGELIGKSQIAFHTPAYKKYHLSYVPDQEIIGMVIPHGEAITLNQALKVGEYSPTVHYVYRVCKQTKAIMDKMTFEELASVKNWRVLNPYEDDMVGEDRVGALLMFPRNPITGEDKPWTYWFGSILGQGSNEFFGPTNIQVTVGVLSALKYIVMNNTLGPLYPENVPTDFVLKNCMPFMGRIVSSETKWTPPSTHFIDLSQSEYDIR